MPTYKNPILFCDYSDPDVIRTDDTYYMTASSFNFTPGLPVLASHNLIDWKLINYAVKNIPLPGYEIPQHGKGLWAPSIRFHNGVYYIFVATPDEGIFYTKTDNPAHEWTPLQMIWSGKGFIDPCPFWDDDGALYIIHAYAKSRIGFNSKIGLLKADSETLKCYGEDVFIFDGTKTQPTIEGPKVYKREGWYYIFAPAGGVRTGWQTVLRSKQIMGPYESKIVMVQGKSSINGPHQGGLVSSPDGQNWFIHFQDRGIYGRITLLEPVSWKDGWPQMGTAAFGKIVKPGEPVLTFHGPAFNSKDTLAANGNGDLNWQWSANHTESFATFKSEKSIILNVLDTSVSDTTDSETFPTIWGSANILTKKINYESFTFNARFDIQNLPLNTRTGILFMGDQYAFLAVEHNNNGYWLRFMKSTTVSDTEKRGEECIDQILLPSEAVKNTVLINVSFTADSARSGTTVFNASYLSPQGTIYWQPHPDTFKTTKAQWVGGRIGLFAIGKNSGTVIVSDITEKKK